MIEDKEIGLKIAENETEAFWHQAKKNCEKGIFNAEREIEINKTILILCEEKLEKSK